MNKAEENFLNLYGIALQGGSFPPKGCLNDPNTAADSNKASALSLSDWRQIFHLADIHHVFPMIYETVWKGSRESGAAKSDLSFVKTDYFQKGLQKSIHLTTAQARRTAEFLKLYRFLLERDLHPIVMKGIICRCLYPNPEQRASSDEDLLVPEEEFPKYVQAFQEYGLHTALPECDLKKDHEVPFCSDHVYIELHK